MTDSEHMALSKVPAITLGFWIIKILATTFGETAGDMVSMTMDLGYLTSTIGFLALLIALASWQIAAKQFHPMLYWAKSSHRQRLAQRWLILQHGRLALAMLAAHYYWRVVCSGHWQFGNGRQDRLHQTASVAKSLSVSSG
jgi:hypothetical protein